MNKTASQSEDFKYFVEQHDSLFNLFPNKYIVIKDKEVHFSDDTFEGALNKALQNGLEVGTFIIQECAEGEDSYTQSFNSRVVFA